MADSEPESGSFDSRRQSNPPYPPPPTTTHRSEWFARSSSMDSGISELLPSSPGGTPSPIIPHSPSRPSRPISGGYSNKRQPSQRSQRAMNIHQDASTVDTQLRSPMQQTVASRPNSAFTSYSPLPHIGQQDSDLGMDSYHASNNLAKYSTNQEYNGMPEQSHAHNRTVSPKQAHIVSGAHQTSPTPPKTTSRPHSGKKISTRELRRQQFARRKSSQPDTTASTTTCSATLSEPSDNEPRILLALKLPNGERLQRYFRPCDCFANVCTYAELESKQSLSNCNMFINQVPKILIQNWKQTFHEADLKDRTLLCLEEKDD